MGAVSSRLEDSPQVYLRDQTRLSIASVQITNVRKKVLLTVVPNSFPSTRVYVRKEAGDDSLVEYVQDPDLGAAGNGLLLKVTNEDELYFNFTFNVRKAESNAQAVDTNINGLTFITCSNHKDLDNLVTREFHADPNIHRHPNVELVGDYSTDGSAAVSFEWKWKWRQPHGADDRNAGFRNTCSFVEYDQRAHRLSILAEFSIWVQGANKSPTLLSPTAGLDPRAIPRTRLSSNYSIDSRVNEGYPDNMSEPKTPGAEGTFELLSPVGTAPQPPQPAPPQVKVDVTCHKPQDDTMGDDGPLFRATMKSLESRTATLRQKMKKVLKRAQEAKMAQVECNNAVQAFMDSLRDAASSNASGIKPAMEHYFDRAAKEIFRFEKLNEYNLQKLIIEPMNKIYNLDIKQAEGKKKEFDDESRDYYAYLSRYLGMRSDSVNQKKKSESDSKYQTKRRNFEIKRFDYSSFMQDLHGGKKEQELLSQLTKYADAQSKSFMSTSKKIQELMPHIDALSREVSDMDKEYDMQKTEREERRRLLEKSTMQFNEPELPSLISPPIGASTSSFSTMVAENGGSTMDSSSRSDGGHATRTHSSAHSVSVGVGETYSTLVAPSTASMSNSSATTLVPVPTSASGHKFKGIRDLDENHLGLNGDRRLEQDRKKEGLLWALSRPGSHADPKGLNKQAWHKYWVVLAGGQLCEYSNWKQKLDLHNDPINLRMASVREARGAERRFCFEVITPQYKRVYQATSEDDMNNWISSIDNAVKGTLEGAGSTIAFDASKLEDDPSRKDISQVFGSSSKMPHIPGVSSLTSSSSSSNNLHRRITVGARPAYNRRSSTFADDPEKLLQMVRDADPGNSSCADCRSQVKTEWVSINLGIVLCIECSGLHRSLGTHISKVRSLTLDVHSFTPDLTELLCKIGNTMSNEVWEAKLDASARLGAQSSRDARLKFITAKYVDRSYVQPISPTLSAYGSSDATLLAAAKKGDVAQALYALALHGNPNSVDPSTGASVIVLALASADPLVKSEAAALPSGNGNGPPAAGTIGIPSIGPPGSPTPPNSGKDTREVTFALAELIVQNGGGVPSTYAVSSSSVQVSSSAKNYLAIKREKTNLYSNPTPDRRTLSPTDGQGSSGVGGGSNSTSPMQMSLSSSGSAADKKDKDKKDKEEKLRKRVSSGGRLPRPNKLDQYKE